MPVRIPLLDDVAAACGAFLTFTVRYACGVCVVAKPAQGRPRGFGSAVGCADCPAMLATLAWR
ncbi:MAG TPA: hypothetical protein VET87_08805, partial [Rubrivivax sp.]|nr:hypothetical protein [Rubrivivax sp.]